MPLDRFTIPTLQTAPVPLPHIAPRHTPTLPSLLPSPPSTTPSPSSRPPSIPSDIHPHVPPGTLPHDSFLSLPLSLLVNTASFPSLTLVTG